MSDASLSRQGALDRLRELCKLVQEFVGLVPTVLPVAGAPLVIPSEVAYGGDLDRRGEVDALLAKVSSWKTWEELAKPFPEHAGKLRLLARTLDALAERFRREDDQLQAEQDAWGQADADAGQAYEAAKAEGTAEPRYRRVWRETKSGKVLVWSEVTERPCRGLGSTPPDRLIYPKELRCITSYLKRVIKALGLKESGGATSSTSATLAPAATSEDGQPPGQGNADYPDLVTLNQAAAIIPRSKRTLERYKTKGKLPPPYIEGGGGRPDLWDWDVIRKWIEEEFKLPKPLPKRFPGKRH